MLGLHEDALVQYDELDALFTRFILNHAVGGKSTEMFGYKLWMNMPVTKQTAFTQVRDYF